MMRFIRTKAVDLIQNPIRCGSLAVSILLGLGAMMLGAREVSYVYPGPAIAVGGVAVVALVVGWVIGDLWHIHHGSPARVLGLELLVNRWQEFEPKERDSVILYQQIATALSMADLAYKRFDEIRFVKVFPGTKVRSGAFLIQPGNDRSLVLKFDSVENIRKEGSRYKHCVATRLGQTPGEPWVPPQRYGRIEDRDWGAIAYNLIGANRNDLDQLQTFGEYFAAHDSLQQIENTLNHIFEALEPWWKNVWTKMDDCSQWRHDTLYGEYDRLKRRRDQMEEGIAQVGQALQIETLQDASTNSRYVSLGDGLRLRNPINWIRGVFEAKRLDEWTTQDSLRRDSIVHGDFHAGNILISEGDSGQPRAWIIDFPHTHVGPTVQDIARLEADIKFGLLPDDTLKALGINELYDFETRLLPESDQPALPLATLMPDQYGMTDKQLHKVWTAVGLLRNEARSYLIGDDARPYHLALLHATLPVLYYRDRTQRQKLYAFVSAALLCQRLGG
jgi:hypothetical protein